MFSSNWAVYAQDAVQHVVGEPVPLHPTIAKQLVLRSAFFWVDQHS